MAKINTTILHSVNGIPFLLEHFNFVCHVFFGEDFMNCTVCGVERTYKDVSFSKKGEMRKAKRFVFCVKFFFVELEAFR